MASRRGVLWVMAALVLWVLSAEALSAVAAAQTTTVGRAPVSDRRLVRLFDFEAVDAEGMKQGLGFDLPEHWYAIGRASLDGRPDFADPPLHGDRLSAPGFPRHAEVRFDGRHAESGDFSVLLSAEGADAGLFLAVRTVTAIPGSDYRITARTRTQGLERSGAVLRAYFIDQTGAEVPGSAVESAPLRSEQDWSDLTVTLLGDHPSAADIGIELMLRQPRPSAADPLSVHRAIRRDLSGYAWFDDVAVWQLPFAEVSTDRPHNIVAEPDTPKVLATVRDLSGTRLWSRLTVYDHNLTAVAQRSEAVGPGRPTQWSWEPILPGFGWYLLDLEVFDGAPPRQRTSHAGPQAGPILRDVPPGAVRVGRAVNAMLYTPEPQGSRATVDRFTVALPSAILEDDRTALAPDAVYALGLRRFEAPAWPTDLTAEALPARLTWLDRTLLARADVLGVSAALRLNPAPEQVELVESALGQPAVAAIEDPVWADWSQPTLRALGQRVGRWMVGGPQGSDLAQLEDLRGWSAKVDQKLRAVAPGPEVMLPWPITQTPPGLPTTAESLGVSVRWPQSVTPEGVAPLIPRWSARQVPYELRLEPSRADRVPHQERIADLLLRMIHGREAGAERFVLEEPWAPGVTRLPSISPGPLAGVFAQTAYRLAGRSAVDRLALDQGVECVIFDGAQGPMLAAWVNDTGKRTRTLELDLGGKPEAVDPWGNRTPLSEGEAGHRLTLTPTPVFIEGIDGELARFRAGLVVDEPLLDAVQAPQNRVLTLVNPWRRTMTGMVFFEPPEGWTIQPGRHRFSIPAGGSMQVPIQVRFPVSQPGGRVSLTGRFEVDVDKPRSFTAQTPMEIRFAGMRLDARAAAVPDASTGQVELVVSAVATNTGDEPRTVYLFAQCGPLPRQETLAPRIEPGQSVVRRFVFRDAAEALQQHPIRVGLREPEGPAVLNKIIDAVR
ncbi:MAG: hypothetical protein AAF288_01125 [Planctomycetota bacterium]